jgi:hypothetical protein
VRGWGRRGWRGLRRVGYVSSYRDHKQRLLAV